MTTRETPPEAIPAETDDGPLDRQPRRRSSPQRSGQGGGETIAPGHKRNRPSIRQTHIENEGTAATWK